MFGMDNSEWKLNECSWLLESIPFSSSEHNRLSAVAFETLRLLIHNNNRTDVKMFSIAIQSLSVSSFSRFIVLEIVLEYHHSIGFNSTSSWPLSGVPCSTPSTSIVPIVCRNIESIVSQIHSSFPSSFSIDMYLLEVFYYTSNDLSHYFASHEIQLAVFLLPLIVGCSW